MKNLQFYLIVILISFILSLHSYSQVIIPCDSTYNGIDNYYLYNKTFCPLTTDMPYDVMIGYFVFDSICTSVNAKQYSPLIFGHQTLNDTLLMIMKFLFKMVDYNPILFDNNTWGMYSQKTKFTNNPLRLFQGFLQYIEKISDHPKLDGVILGSDYIYHIYVNNVVDGPPGPPNLNPINQYNWTFVQCTVLDTIKGRVYPSCYNDYYKSKNKSKKYLPLSNESSSCFQFQYCPQWDRGKEKDAPIVGRDTFLVDSLGNHWIKPGEEYIVFLFDLLLCTDSIGFNLCTVPDGLETMTYTMYPIKSNGTVYDPGNDFGFGTPINVNTFKQAIRNRINFIINR